MKLWLVIYTEIKNTTLEEKVNKVVSVISSECFSNLPMKVKIYGNDIAKIELLEFDESLNKRVSWKEDYLNEDHSLISESELQEIYNIIDKIKELIAKPISYEICKEEE